MYAECFTNYQASNIYKLRFTVISSWIIQTVQGLKDHEITYNQEICNIEFSEALELIIVGVVHKIIHHVLEYSW